MGSVELCDAVGVSGFVECDRAVELGAEAFAPEGVHGVVCNVGLGLGCMIDAWGEGFGFLHGVEHIFCSLEDVHVKPVLAGNGDHVSEKDIAGAETFADEECLYEQFSKLVEFCFG